MIFLQLQLLQLRVLAESLQLGLPLRKAVCLTQGSDLARLQTVVILTQHASLLNTREQERTLLLGVLGLAVGGLRLFRGNWDILLQAVLALHDFGDADYLHGLARKPPPKALHALGALALQAAPPGPSAETSALALPERVALLAQLAGAVSLFFRACRLGQLLDSQRE